MPILYPLLKRGIVEHASPALTMRCDQSQYNMAEAPYLSYSSDIHIYCPPSMTFGLVAKDRSEKKGNFGFFVCFGNILIVS